MANPCTLVPSKTNYDRAYIWLMMKGDNYLPGIFTSVYSIARTHPAADLVVMVTEDVSSEARSVLLKVATHLLIIPYLTFNSKPLKTQRQRDMYGSWISSSYSKWNCLAAVQYKKVVFIDGDTINTENTDELFDLPAPAFSCSSPFMKPLGTVKSFYRGPKGLDGYLVHGTKVPPEELMQALTSDSIVVIAAPCVLEPNLDEYNLYIDTISKMQPFGFSAHNGMDEQSITYFYAEIKKQAISVIHQRYGYIAWKDEFLYKGDVPRIIHYFSDTKPWSMKFNEYPDVISWYKMAALACKSVGIAPEAIRITGANCESAVNAEDVFIKKFINVTDITDIYKRLKPEN